MIRTLRARVVFTYIGVVTVSVIAAFLVYNFAFSGPETRRYEREAKAALHAAVQLYERVQPADEDAFWDGIARTRGAALRLYEADGAYREYGDAVGMGDAVVSRGDIAAMLDGNEPAIAADPSCGCELVVGTRLSRDSGAAALVMFPRAIEGEYGVLVILGVVFAVGSGLFLLVSGRLVGPIRSLTAAAARMSEGDLRIRLPDTRSKDELGDLSRAFNHMAGQLERQDRMRQQFVADVSHELQSPLTSIRGFASMLRSPGMPEADRERALRAIHEESERLSKLNGHLLVLATLDAGHCPFDPQPVRVDEQMRRSMLLLEPQWSSKEIEVVCDLPALAAAGNHALLEQLWVNLLGNAIKYTPAKGRITATGERGANEITITIADTGIGIAPADLEHIFERFYKADEARNRNVEGSGLGLSIAKQIVLLHEGRIEAASVPGGGSAFMVRLPLARRAAGANAPVVENGIA
ncbi:sensor histidine kinase [Paenibacillus methanolicus]|uniref:histidine kinase n=1 Tax=Paenibacillus methanolicus TaxID=582686 RepID=A0A5S5BX76_9BACL|nr:HAMP domain-containing sensor histidine kinase [Paenibacillus methanolicus]TYP70740.1 signal transduction histidine kinase [Paenibacillus methanolicus]